MGNSHSHNDPQSEREGLVRFGRAESRAQLRKTTDEHADGGSDEDKALKKAKRESLYHRVVDYFNPDTWAQLVLSKLDFFKRKLPELFAAFSAVLVLVNSGLYVYDLYTDVILVRFLLGNGYLWAAILSIIFIVNHYFLVAWLLSWKIKDLITSSIQKDIEKEELLDLQIEAGDIAAIKASQGISRSTFIRAMRSPIVYWILMPIIIGCVFLLTCLVIPIVDLFMIAFDIIKGFSPSVEGDENPLNSIFVNFLLQYRTLRVPMEVILQSIPQTILTGVLYRYISNNPPAFDQDSASDFNLSAVIQAVASSAANLLSNGITVYLASKMAGRSLFEYIWMAMQFEGAADLPPDWEVKIDQHNISLQGNFHSLKLTQQMKILNTALRRTHITLRTGSKPLNMTDEQWLGWDEVDRLAADKRRHKLESKEGLSPEEKDEEKEEGKIKSKRFSSACILFEQRKMVEWLYEWNPRIDERRLPSKVIESNSNKSLEINVRLFQVHRLPLKSENDAGDDMGFKEEQLNANSKVASTESVAMWLISHRHIVNFLVSVRINDCNIDSSLMLPLLTQNGAHSSPLVDLLSSKSIKVLDLSENPLFKILYDQPRLDEWEEVESSDDPLLVAERIQSRTNSLALPTKNKVEADQLQREARLLLKERERLRIKGIKEFTQALRDNTSLTEINLSSTCMDPLAAIKVLEALSEPLMVSGLLRAVDISKNPILKAKEDYVISNEALEIQAMDCGTTYSPDTLGTATTTERDALHHYYIRCLEMALDRCQGINDLNISTTFLSKDQLAPLMQGLQFNRTLCKLDLSNCKVVHDEIESFSNMLMENKSIDSLVLRSTGLTSHSMEKLSHAIHHNSKCISSLDLSDNLEIKDEGISHLTLALERRGQGMQSLMLSSVGMTAFSLIPLLRRGLYSAASLALLDVSSCQFGSCRGPASPSSVSFNYPLTSIDEGEMESMSSESSFQRLRADVPMMETITERKDSVIACCEAIEHLLIISRRLSQLNLANCEMCVRAITRFSRSIKDHAEWLEELDLSCNPFGPDGAKELADVLYNVKKPQPSVSIERWRAIDQAPNQAAGDVPWDLARMSSQGEGEGEGPPDSPPRERDTCGSLRGSQQNGSPSLRGSQQNGSPSLRGSQQNGSPSLRSGGENGGEDYGEVDEGIPHCEVDEGIPHWEPNPYFSLGHLKVLSLSAVNLTSHGFEDLMDALSANEVLEELDVSRNFIRTVDVTLIRESTFHDFNCNNTSLRKLDMRWNRVPIATCTQMKSFFSIDGKKKSKAGIKHESRLRFRDFKAQLKEIFFLEEDRAEYELLANLRGKRSIASHTSESCLISSTLVNRMRKQIDSFLDLRSTSPVLPDGKCVYIQAGDPSDFDGYYVAFAGMELERQTADLEFALVVPERRATSSRTDVDVNAHEQEFSERVMDTSHHLFSIICGQKATALFRGPLNQRNVIPLKYIFSEPDLYGPLAADYPQTHIQAWQTIQDLAIAIERPEVKTVMVDAFGSIGYLEELMRAAPSLGAKMKASNMPVIMMAGIEAESTPATLAVPGRDPRATMNAIYHKDGVQAMLELAEKHDIPLLFVTNTDCNEMLKFEDAREVIKALGLKGLLKDLAKAWYGPHLKGKCVPFDWVSFFAMLCYERFPHLIKLEKRQLLVGENDASILVLKHSSKELTPEQQEVVKMNERGTKVWGTVISIVPALETKKSMLDLARVLSRRLRTPASVSQQRRGKRIRRVAVSLLGVGALAVALALRL